MSKKSLETLLDEALDKALQLRADYTSAWLKCPDSEESREAEKALEDQRLIIVKLHQQIDTR